MFDDFDLFETCEEYYDDLDEWETEQAFLSLQNELMCELTEEDIAELDKLFP